MDLVLTNFYLNEIFIGTQYYNQYVMDL